MNDARKRRRIEKTVRFDIEHIVIIDTYSPTDYDRGGSLYSYPPIQYKLNPNRKIPSLSLNYTTSSESSLDSDDSLIETPTLLDRKRKPKLTVNTNCIEQGPLFFTKLSTNHFKHSIHDSDSEDDYLVPITPKHQTNLFLNYH